MAKRRSCYCCFFFFSYSPFTYFSSFSTWKVSMSTCTTVLLKYRVLHPSGRSHIFPHSHTSVRLESSFTSKKARNLAPFFWIWTPTAGVKVAAASEMHLIFLNTLYTTAFHCSLFPKLQGCQETNFWGSMEAVAGFFREHREALNVFSHLWCFSFLKIPWHIFLLPLVPDPSSAAEWTPGGLLHHHEENRWVWLCSHILLHYPTRLGPDPQECWWLLSPPPAAASALPSGSWRISLRSWARLACLVTARTTMSTSSLLARKRCGGQDAWGDSPIALLSTEVKYSSQYLNMQTLQEQAGIAFDDIELLRDSQNRSFFARTGSRKQENGQNTDCVMARSPMSTSSAFSAFSKSTCAYWGPDTKGGQVTPLPGGLGAGQ